MKYAWTVMVFAAACGGGSGSTPDAATPDAGTPDADGGGAPDAEPTVDTDGDGVFDHVDVCPAIADPAQVDLDGDQSGWMCDPVESTTIPYTGLPSDFRLAVRSDTAGASFHYACETGTCQSAALSVGPGGVSLADSHTDAWLAARPSWGWVAAENRVLWSFIAGGLGEHDAASDTFTAKYDGVLQGGDAVGTVRFERDQLTVLPSYSPTQGHALLEPRANGEVFIIAESASPYDVKVITGHDPANLVFTNAATASRSLRRFVPGTAASEAVIVDSVALSDVGDVKAITTSTGALTGVCAEQDGVRYLIPTDDNSVPGQVLPLPSCNVYGAQTLDQRLRVIVASIDGSHPTGGVVFVLDGVMHALDVVPYGVEVFGRSLPAAIRTTAPGGEQTVHAVTATGAVHLVASDVTDTIVSAEGATIHVLATRGSDHVLFRYRDGAVSETTLPAYTATLDETVVLTTREGAALVSTFETAFVVPSQTMTATAIDFDNLRGFVRGDATLFVASHNASSSKPALYSYREVEGVPQYSALTTESNATLYAYPLDGHDGARTEWFAYVKDGTCMLARPEVTSSTVNLLGNTLCLAGAGVEGVTRDNKLVVRIADNASLEQLYLVDGDTLTKVATSSTQLRLMYATQESRVVVGWVGRDTTSNDFVCLGTHPERCWTPPLATYTWAAPVTGQPDSLHVVFLEQLTGSVKFTSIRAIGPGTRPQPL